MIKKSFLWEISADGADFTDGESKMRCSSARTQHSGLVKQTPGDEVEIIFPIRHYSELLLLKGCVGPGSTCLGTVLGSQALVGATQFQKSWPVKKQFRWQTGEQ